VEAYCVKCKTKREILDPEATFTSSGTPGTRGICSICGTKVFRMGRTEAHEGLTPPEAPPRKRGKRTSSAKMRRNGKLVIVESPAKARTVGRYLGNKYVVKASIGHVRDLLRSQLSVDVENNFEPKYRVPNEKREIVKELKKDVASAEEVFLATDLDREGEAIAWHLLEAAQISPEQARRVVFHEITKESIRRAFDEPREINMCLVDAQQARRILDRLVGYNLSPLLWAKVKSRLSAGRVQSPALRMIVDREREIQNFVPEEYWSIDGEFEHPEKPPAFKARLVQINGDGVDLPSQQDVNTLLGNLRNASYLISKIKRGTRKRNPSAPFITSTLQQDASRSLKFTARRTMRVAQQLYEGIDVGTDEPIGLITYMRTDSTNVSDQAVKEARQVILEEFGQNYLPQKPPTYRSRAKRAQEAHEAIRPTSAKRKPEDLKSFLTKEQFSIYELIWKRFISSQMKPAIYDTLTIEVLGAFQEHSYLFRVSASSLKFAGFLLVYEENIGETTASKRSDEIEMGMSQLPNLIEGDPVELLELYPEQHFTQPPPRYSDATLIRALEEFGIGRPSTYAPILTTLRQRGYIVRQDRRLLPTEIGEIVNDLIVDHFPEIVDFGFTAKMEDDLDQIAEGTRQWVEVVRAFYEPFAKEIEKAKEEMPEVKAEPEKLGRNCPECGHPLVIRHGRFGKFVGCSDFPNCRYTEPWLEKIGVECPQCDGDIVERRTKKGRIFYGCSNYPECDFTSWKKPLDKPCSECGGLLVIENKNHASCLNCKSYFELEEIQHPGSEVA
jgi:DNA topoisomerase-1